MSRLLNRNFVADVDSLSLNDEPVIEDLGTWSKIRYAKHHPRDEVLEGSWKPTNTQTLVALSYAYQILTQNKEPSPDNKMWRTIFYTCITIE